MDLWDEFYRYMKDAYQNQETNRTHYEQKSLWDMLASDRKFDLIEKLKHVEDQEGGYMSIVVPPEGYSENDDTHNAVLDWLQDHGVNIINVNLSVERMRRALHPEMTL